uniref:Tc1-like transposase DDE domain-containing protein n=1 Tax=Scylla olivacea TaxID=85551 RepID=A0A0P4VZQ3_SCYOL
MVNFYEIGDSNLFMHDTAPCHKAKVMNWLKDKKVDVLEWPGNSPDLNPFEKLWENMKLKLQERDTSTLSTWLKHSDIWVHDTKVDYCKTQLDSMPRHTKAIVKAHGGHSKY